MKKGTDVFFVLLILIMVCGCEWPFSDSPNGSNADLRLLSVDSGTLSPAFDKEITSYTVHVANAVSSITISGESADPEAHVNAPITLSDLAVGVRQTVNVTVTAADGGTEKTYSVAITRDEPGWQTLFFDDFNRATSENLSLGSSEWYTEGNVSDVILSVQENQLLAGVNPAGNASACAVYNNALSSNKIRISCSFTCDSAGVYLELQLKNTRNSSYCSGGIYIGGGGTTGTPGLMRTTAGVRWEAGNYIESDFRPLANTPYRVVYTLDDQMFSLLISDIEGSTEYCKLFFQNDVLSVNELNDLRLYASGSQYPSVISIDDFRIEAQ